MESLLDIRVGEALFGKVFVEPPWALRIVPGAYATLYAMHRGAAMLEFDDGTTRLLETGSVVSILNGREHRLRDTGNRSRATPPVPLRLETLDLPDVAEPSVATGAEIAAARVPIGANPLPDILAEIIYVPPVEREIAARLYAVLEMAVKFRHAPETIREPVTRRIAEILAIELTEFSLSQEKSGMQSRIHDPRIRRTVALMRVHPERPWTLAGFCREACMSRSAFAARFREVVGRPPLAYLQSLRMERARELLRNSEMPVYEIASRVGYGSDTAFSKAFAREFSESPARFRKAVKQSY